MWLSPLESVRLNTVSLWPKQATLSSGTDPALVRSTGTLSDFADCCELLSKVRISAFILML